MSSSAPGEFSRRFAASQRMPLGRVGLIGIGLSTLIIVSWLALHIYAVHFFEFRWATAPLVPLMMGALCWLSVGLFIISHDAIHGSLVPGHRGLNRAFGWVVMTLYAGFNYDNLERKHHLHHDAPGTAEDPDFSADHPSSFFAWFKEFFLNHFGLRPFLFVNGVVLAYYLVFGASQVNVVLFYGIPAIGSCFQLFYFGTYLPHRHVQRQEAFTDDHRTRSTGFGWLLSLLTCYHFGYHHEHHLYPHEPWWRLPARRGEVPSSGDTDQLQAAA